MEINHSLTEIHKLKAKIHRLEAKVKRLEQHHQHCAVTRRRLSSHSTDREVPIIVFNVNEQDSTVKAQAQPKWRKYATRFLDGVPTTTDWIKRREQLGLVALEDNETAIAAIAGDCSPRWALQLSKIGPLACTDDLLCSARAYAQITRRSSVDATFTSQLRSFQDVVFVSLCAVLEQCGVPVEQIDDVMRLSISDSQPIHLKRLRAGATWANQVISVLSKAGWGFRATEMLLICEIALSRDQERNQPLIRPRWVFGFNLRHSLTECHRFNALLHQTFEGCKLYSSTSRGS